MHIFLGVIACFVLSGFAALLYQTAWMRQFSLVFGTSELAIAAVLAAYMGGLALGAAIAARYVHRIRRPILFYALLEGGIAISALAVPWLLSLLNAVYVGLFGGQPEPVDASGLGQSFFYLGSAFIVLAIPTSFMGATLPLLTKYVVQSDDQIGPRVGLIYSMNTVGAVAGTVVAGFILLPALGLTGTVWVGVAVNLLVFVIAALLAKAVARNAAATIHEVGEADVGVTPPEPPMRGRTWILPLMLISGVNSFVYEVLWTRLLGHILGGSITAFATMLASFLGGIAIGSAIASRFATTRTAALNAFIVVQCGIAVASMAIYEMLPLAIPETSGLKGNAILAVFILLPATVFIGATFPLAVRIFARDGGDAAPASARVYSWNTVGAIVGATAAAFFLIPMLKYEGAIRVAVIVNVALAMGAALLIGKRHTISMAITAAALIAVGVAYQPAMPEAMLRTSPVIDQHGGEIRYYEVGRSATVLVLEESGFFNLRTNGLPEASTNLIGAPPYKHNQRLLSALPILARPDVEEMLIVGFGAGATLEGVPPSVKSIDVVELEPMVIEANRSIGKERQIDPLADPRVNIYINDARSALALTSKKYDAIVSQPSHPWTAGASHLYTREFMSLANDHLNEDGVYLQWMNTQFIDEALLKSLCATMLEVFDNVRVYQWDPQVLFFLGSAAPMNIELDMVRTGRPLSDDRVHYLQKGVGSVEDVVVALSMDHKNVVAFAASAEPITDNFNLMATRSAAAMDNGTTIDMNDLSELLAPFDPLLQADSFLHNDFPSRLDFGYVSRRLEGMYMQARAVALADTLLKLRNPESLVMVGLGQQRQGEVQDSQRNLLMAISADPNSEQGKYALLRPWLSRLSRGEKPPQKIRETLMSIRGSAAMTIRAWLAASQGNYQEVANLDEALATVLTTDLWYKDAMKLRIDWRIKVTTPDLQPGLAREATALIDEAIALYQDQDFYAMRLASSFVADDAAEMIETARRLIYIFDHEIKLAEDGQFAPEPAALRAKMMQVNAVQSVLVDVENDDRIPAYKRKQLAHSIEQVSIRLNALAEGHN
jgi:spermidine synthase